MVVSTTPKPKTVAFQKDLKKTKQLELILVEELRSRGFVPHSRFLSEREIRARFGCSQTVVRRAINNLSGYGHLYRINGSGTFVAPKRQKAVLFVSRHSMKYGIEYSAVFEVFVGALAACEQNPHGGITCSILTSDEMLSHLGDCEQVFPNLAAVVFLYDPESCRICRPVLEAKRIHSFYYGTQESIANFDFPYTLTYSQATIAELALGYLVAKGYKNIGLLSTMRTPCQERLSCCRRWMESNGLRLPANYNLIVDFPFDSSRQERIGIFDAYFSASPLPENMEALVCMDDTLAMYFLSASSNRRRRINGQLSIMGISNKPLCEELVPKLTSVEIPFFNDAKTIIETLYSVFEGGEPECHLKSSVKIIQRQSA